MIDPAIIDLMDRLSQQPLALMSAANIEGGRTSDLAKRMEAIVRQNENFVDEWSQGAQDAVSELIRMSKANNFSSDSLALLMKTVATAERRIEEDKSEFKRQQKGAHRAIKRLKAYSKAEGEIGEQMFSRFLAATARMGVIRFELGLAIRALCAERDPENRTGPVFDDPDQLEKYLLSAVA